MSLHLKSWQKKKSQPKDTSASTEESRKAAAPQLCETKKCATEVVPAAAVVCRPANRFQILAKLLGREMSMCSLRTTSSPSASTTSSWTNTASTIATGTESKSCTDTKFLLSTHSPQPVCSLEDISNEELGKKVRTLISDSSSSTSLYSRMNLDLRTIGELTSPTTTPTTTMSDDTLCNLSNTHMKSCDAGSSAVSVTPLQFADVGVQTSPNESSPPSNENFDINELLEQMLNLVASEFTKAMKILMPAGSEAVPVEMSESSFDSHRVAQACSDVNEFLAALPETSTVSGYVKSLETVARDYVRLIKESTKTSHSTA